MQKKHAKLTVISVICLFILSPFCVWLSLKYSQNNYYLPSVIIIILSLIPFFVWFEHKKIKTGELVTVAVMISLCVASRAVMAFIPQVKPTCALVIVTAVAFGPNVGFVTGSLSMFISNFLFGQGIFTPFQMLGMGLTGFLCGILFYKKKYAANRFAVGIVGGLACLFVYGLTVDSCSVLTMTTEPTAKSVFAILASGIPFNLIHAVTTSLLLFFINKPMTDKFSRLRIKYGIFELE